MAGQAGVGFVASDQKLFEGGLESSPGRGRFQRTLRSLGLPLGCRGMLVEGLIPLSVCASAFSLVHSVCQCSMPRAM